MQGCKSNAHRRANSFEKQILRLAALAEDDTKPGFNEDRQNKKKLPITRQFSL
jgi:hypothetical protein